MAAPMAPRVDLKPVVELTGAERAALRDLSAAVYPPEVLAASPGRLITWTSPPWGVLVWSEDGELVSYTGAVVREAAVDGVPTTIGGVGSVKTHPHRSGRGYATLGLRRADCFLTDEHAVAFSLLVCRDPLIPFYERLGWRVFEGTLLVEQPSGPAVFTVNRPMVRPNRTAAPHRGTIDLQGLPW